MPNWEGKPGEKPWFSKKPWMPELRPEWAHLSDEQLPKTKAGKEELTLRKHLREQAKLQELVKKPLF